MKRLLIAIPVVLVFVFSLAVPAFAADGMSTLQVSGTVETGAMGYVYGNQVEDVTTPYWELHDEKSVEFMQGTLQETKVANPYSLDKSTLLVWPGAEGWSSQQRYQDGIFDISQKVSADVGEGEYTETKDINQKADYAVSKTLDYEGAMIMMEMSAINMGDVNTGAGMSLDATLVDELSVDASSTDDGIPNIPAVPAHCEWVEAYCDPGKPAECVGGGCATCPVPGKCVGGSCDMCGDNKDHQCSEFDNNPDACEACQCCEYLPETTVCEMCCTLEDPVPPHCVAAHCEWIEEDPGSWGTQDIFSFEVDVVWMEGNIATGLSVLPKNTQDIEATEQQSWTGAFTFNKKYVVTDNDPIPEPDGAAPPVPIPPVP